MKKVISKILICLLILIVAAVVLVLQCSSPLVKENGTNAGEYFFEESGLEDDEPIVNIAMLGAHDAFTSELSRKNGGNVYEGGLTDNKWVRIFGGGLVTRLAKAQMSDANKMLLAGVRYFDVRITKIDGKYYAFHGYLSGEIKDYVQDIVDFLGTHPDEFVIFDIQHFYTENGENFDLPASDYSDLLEYFYEIKNPQGKSLCDYIKYNTKANPLSELTYGDVKGGVVLLAKVKDSDYFYERDGDANYDDSRSYTSIYSYWLNENDTETMLEEMTQTMNYVEYREDLKTVLRVNQAQKTGFFTDSRLVSSIFQWSLLDMAADFNSELVSDSSRLKDFLASCPILMVDNATSTKDGFNTKVLEILKEYNNALKYFVGQ